MAGNQRACQLECLPVRLIIIVRVYDLQCHVPADIQMHYRPYGVPDHTWNTFLYGLRCAETGECPPNWKLPQPAGPLVGDRLLVPAKLSTLRVGCKIGGGDGPSVSADCINSYCNLISMKLAVVSPHIHVIGSYGMSEIRSRPKAAKALERARMVGNAAVIVHGIFYRGHHFVMFSADFGTSVLTCYDPLCAVRAMQVIGVLDHANKHRFNAFTHQLWQRKYVPSLNPHPCLQMLTINSGQQLVR